MNLAVEHPGKGETIVEVAASRYPAPMLLAGGRGATLAPCMGPNAHLGRFVPVPPSATAGRVLRIRSGCAFE